MGDNKQQKDSGEVPEHHSKAKGAVIGAAVGGMMAGKKGAVAGAAIGAEKQHKKNERGEK